MENQTQEVVEVTGYTARCTCGWEGNWSPLKDDAELHGAEHGKWHEQQVAEQAEQARLEAERDAAARAEAGE